MALVAANCCCSTIEPPFSACLAATPYSNSSYRGWVDGVGYEALYDCTLRNTRGCNGSVQYLIENPPACGTGYRAPDIARYARLPRRPTRRSWSCCTPCPYVRGCEFVNLLWITVTSPLFSTLNSRPSTTGAEESFKTRNKALTVAGNVHFHLVDDAWGENVPLRLFGYLTPPEKSICR